MVATLHSGSAFATASAFQCVEKNRKEAWPSNAVDDPHADRWMRAEAYVFEDQKQSLVYKIDGTGYFYADGSSCTRLNDLTQATPAKQYVLVAYEPIEEVGGTTDVKRVGYWPAVKVDDGIHQPLTYSCWTSVMTGPR